MATVSQNPTSAVPSSLWSGTVRVMRSGVHDAATNMALDEAMLLTAADTGETLVRFYQWECASVSFGRNQRCDGIYSPERCQTLGVPAVRRLTGGRALVHAREVTYAVAAPTTVAATLRGGYEAINDVLLAALRSLGVAAERASPAARMAPPGLAPCFESPADGELVVDGRKIVGSAQHRDAKAFLQHGAILLADDQRMLHELAMVALPEVPAPATLWGLRPHVSAEQVMDALTESVRAVADGDIVVTADTDMLRHRVEALTTRYRDPLWTWRR